MGINLAPALRGETIPERSIELEVRIGERHGRGTRTATAKTLYPPGSDTATESYDLADDPQELRNLLKQGN
jgi:hypothetical protein